MSEQKRENGIYNRVVKRIIDLVLSALILIVFSPILLLLVLAIKVDSKGPVLFTQKRVGVNKVTFPIYKFRTMRIDTPHDVPTHMLSNPNQYITRVGRFLRLTSLDELPQLWNIFIGQMSFVGPRPALWNQDDLIAERDLYRANAVRPGLTGWAQINGRDELEIPVKAKLDGEYVARLSFGFDLKCFFGTITYVLGRKGVVEGGTGELHRQDKQDK
jgi:O-antigen biosynthesis protein WbqP